MRSSASSVFGRPRRLQDRVAQRAVHPVQDGGVLEESRFGRRQPREELEAEVLRHEPLLAAEAGGGDRARRPGLDRQRGEVQAGRPTLGALGQRGHVGRVERDAGRFEQQPRLPLVQSQLRRRRSPRPRPCARQRASGKSGRFAGRDRDLRPGRNVVQQRRDDVEACRAGDRVQIVEHQHHGALEPSQRIPDARDPRRPRGSAGPGQRVEHRRRERFDAVDRRRDVAQEHDRVVVPAVERDPRERTRIRVGPAGEQRRLAVAGRCDDGREVRARRGQPRDHVRLGHRPGSDQRRGELGLRQIEGDVRIERRRAHTSSALERVRTVA